MEIPNIHSCHSCQGLIIDVTESTLDVVSPLAYEDAEKAWFETQDFILRALGNPLDRSVAIAGLAEHFSVMCGYQYMAGHWR